MQTVAQKQQRFEAWLWRTTNDIITPSVATSCKSFIREFQEDTRNFSD